MRYRVLDATRSLVRNLAYMLWTDAVKVIPGRMPIPGLEDATIDATWSPESRMGEFYDYNQTDVKVRFWYEKPRPQQNPQEK